MLENTENKVVFVIGAEKIYPFPIRFFDKSEIKCYVKNGNTDRELLPGEFTVEDKEDYSEGADITLVAPFSPGGKLVIMRECPISQKVSFPLNGKFSSKNNEYALDKLTMICQQLKEELVRCVKVAATDGQKPEDVIAMLLGAKDMALSAAESAADANASTAAAALTVHTIWSEITGNDASAQEALEALKQAFEAAGSVEAAAAAGRESVNAASLAAVEYAQGQIEESKNASVEVLSATTRDRKAELLALISETIGAEGAVAAAVKAAEDAAINAKESADSIDAATQEAVASVNAAVGVADQKSQEALAAATEAKVQAEQAGNAAAESYGYIAETLANKNASAQSAQDAAHSAASAQISADAAAAAAGEAAETAAQRSITAHNSNVTSHPDIRKLIDGKLSASGGQISGAILKDTDDSALSLFGATAHKKGAELNLYGVNHASAPGVAELAARSADGTAATLNLYPDGKLKLDGREVFTSAGGTVTGPVLFNGAVAFGATSDTEGGEIKLAGSPGYGDSVIDNYMGATRVFSPGGVLLEIDHANKKLRMNGYEIGRWCPNYEAGIAMPDSFTAPSDGWVFFHVITSTISWVNVIVNSVSVAYFAYTGGYQHGDSAFVPVAVGDTFSYTMNGEFSASQCVFYPNRGF